MPTQKRRILVTVEDADYELLHRLADAGGQSMASIVRELIVAARPTLLRMVEAMDAFAAADADKQRQIIASLEESQAALIARAQAAHDDASQVWDAFPGKNS